MSIETRIRALELNREKHDRRTGDSGIVEDTRSFLESIDGQKELGLLDGEDMSACMVRRMMHLDGFNLDALPGATMDEKWHSADLAAHGKLEISDEARHAARHLISLYVGI